MPRKIKPDIAAVADELAIKTIGEQALPGLAIGIVRNGVLVHARGFGSADAVRGRPVTSETVFRIGSISKTMTAIGLMQLWEQGAFQLDDPVNHYLRGYRVEHPDPAAPPVTFKHLLTHTAGIGEVRSVRDVTRGPMAGLGVKEGNPLPDLTQYYAPVLRTEVYAGAKWAYANHGFATVGQLVEDISGVPFATYMMQSVFEPLGMFGTDFLRSSRVADRLAQGYKHRRGLVAPAKYTEIVVGPAGSVFSSVDDMSKYVAALLGGGSNDHGSILKPDTLALMFTPHYQIDERLPAVGLAFMLERFGSHRIAWHNGGWTGFVSSMMVAPDDGIGVVTFTNSGKSVDKLAAAILRAALDLPDPASELPAAGVSEQPLVWRDLVGTYRPAPGLLTNARIWMGLGGEAAIGVRKGRLHLSAPSWMPSKGMPLYAVDATDPLYFKAVREGNALPVLFRRDATGTVSQVVLGGLMTLHKVAAARSLRTATRAVVGLAVLAGIRKLRATRTQETN